MKKLNVDFDFDFGFSTVDTDEVQCYNKDEIAALHDTIEQQQKALAKMRAAIDVLLNNLSQNPNQELIKWPNRIEKIYEFRKKLDRIQKGEE